MSPFDDAPHEGLSDADLLAQHAQQPPTKGLSDDDLMRIHAPARRGLSDDDLLQMHRPEPQRAAGPPDTVRAPLAGAPEAQLDPPSPTEDKGIAERTLRGIAKPWANVGQEHEWAKALERSAEGTVADPAAKLVAKWASTALNALAASFGSVVNAGAAGATEIARATGMNPDDAERLRRDISGMPEAFMGSIGALKSPPTPFDLAKGAERANPAPGKQVLDNLAQGRPADAPHPETPPAGPADMAPVGEPVPSPPSFQRSPAIGSMPGELPPMEERGAQRQAIGRAAAEASPEPSEAQREAGNYRKGHVNVQGLDVTIETPEGAIRRGVGENGEPWENVSPAHYGYIKRTEGADGEQVDAYIGPHPDSDHAFIVDQIDPKTGEFDEHKTVLGARNLPEAMDIYDAGFSDGSGPQRRSAVTEMSVPEFKDWLKEGDTTAPAADTFPQMSAMAPGARYKGFRPEQPYDPAETPTGRPIRREDIIGPLADAFGVPVYEGRIKQPGWLGFFRAPIEEVRVKRANDIETTAHELAHLLDSRDPEIRRQYARGAPYRNELLGVSYDRTKPHEGFAEFVRLWATQDAEARARAPGFHAWFENYLDRSPYGPALRQAQERMQAWFGEAALDRALSKIGTERSLAQALERIGDRFRQSVLDDLHGIYAMEKATKGAIAPGGAYETSRLTRGARAMVSGAMEYGAPKVLPDGSHTFEGKGLARILEPVAHDVDRFLLYAVGRSAEELRAQGRERLFTPQEIKAMKALETPERRRAFDEYQIWNNRVLDFAQAKGLIDPAARAQWRRSQYLPFYRVGEPGGGAGATRTPGEWRGIRALTGGTENVRDILDNMVGNAAMLIEGALKNEARGRVGDLAKWPGGARFMAEIPKDSRMVKVHQDAVRQAIQDALGVTGRTLSRAQQKVVDDIMKGLGGVAGLWQHGQAPMGKDIVAVMRGGKPQYWQVADPILLRALQALSRPARGVAMRVAAQARRIVQAGITVSPNFLAAHLFRDAVMGGVLSKNGFKPGFDSARGVFSRLAHDDNYKQWIANGGGFIGAHLDEGRFRKRLDAFYGSKGIDPSLVMNSARKVAYGVEAIADAFGSGTRMGEFSRAVKRGVNPRQAAFQSREIATDFSMRGDSPVVRFMFDLVPFLNASTVSADRMIRGFYRSEENRVNNAVKTALLATASAALYAVKSQQSAL